MGDERVEGLAVRVEAGHLDARHLDSGQQAALESLMSGKSMIETSRVTGVSRATLYRWIKSDPEFQAAYNEWRASLQESCQARLLAMADKAAATVEKAVEGGDAKTALALLKGMGLVGKVEPGECDAGEIARQAKLEERERENALETKRFLAGL